MTSLTRTEIVNLALGEIGATRVDDWQEDSGEAIIARDFWDQAVRNALSRHGWQFALKTEELPREAEAPGAGFSYRYTLPGDFLRIHIVSDNATLFPALDDVGTGWDEVDGAIETDAERVFLRHVYDAPVIGRWPPQFVNVLTADYAALMASRLRSSTERERLEKLARQRLGEARGIASVQQSRKLRAAGSWRVAARGGWRG